MKRIFLFGYLAWIYTCAHRSRPDSQITNLKCMNQISRVRMQLSFKEGAITCQYEKPV